MTKRATFNENKFQLVKDSKPVVSFQKGMQDKFSQFPKIDEAESSDTSSMNNSDYPRTNLNSTNSGAATNEKELTTYATSTIEPMIREHVDNDTSDQNSMSAIRMMTNQGIPQGSEKHPYDSQSMHFAVLTVMTSLKLWML